MARNLAVMAQRLPLLEGDLCARVRRGRDADLFLEFGPPATRPTRGRAQPERALGIGCPWRLESASRILVGSDNMTKLAFAEDDPEGASIEPWIVPDRRLEPELHVLAGRRMTRTEVMRPSYMAQIEFEGGLTLWIFQDTATYCTPDGDYDELPWFVYGRAFHASLGD